MGDLSHDNSFFTTRRVTIWPPKVPLQSQHFGAYLTEKAISGQSGKQKTFISSRI